MDKKNRCQVYIFESTNYVWGFGKRMHGNQICSKGIKLCSVRVGSKASMLVVSLTFTFKQKSGRKPRGVSFPKNFCIPPQPVKSMHETYLLLTRKTHIQTTSLNGSVRYFHVMCLRAGGHQFLRVSHYYFIPHIIYCSAKKDINCMQILMKPIFMIKE